MWGLRHSWGSVAIASAIALLAYTGWNRQLSAHDGSDAKKGNDLHPAILTPYWTPSYQLYKQPHAIWLDRYDTPGTNVPALQRLLKAAQAAKQIPEVVIYAIPLRDLGQSSEGGFANYPDYIADNRHNAETILGFVRETGLHPVVYLEPDSIPLAIQYRRDNNEDGPSRQIYAERIQATHTLIGLYHDAGARVYLEAGHSGWFDYGDSDVQRIADALNAAGIAQADGLATNVSNRQPVNDSSDKTTRTEWHYLGRLLPRLQNPHLDVRVDTSRNGGSTQARQYYLAPNGELWDSEHDKGRLIGHWRWLENHETKKGSTDKTRILANASIRFEPFFGKSKLLSRLLTKEKYTLAENRILTAPAWLDAVGDVQPGPAPTDNPPAGSAERIAHYRYIKPPDECDGALNYPPGQSKRFINAETQKRQPEKHSIPMPHF